MRLVTILVALSTVGLGACGGAGGNQTAPARADMTIPGEIALLDMQGQSVRMDQVIGQRIAVIDFWATWCKPCRKSLPKVDELAASVDPQQVVVLAVNVGETREQVQAFQKELGLRLPVLLDTEMALPLHLGIEGLPRLVVVDAAGQVVHIGATFDDAASARLQALVDS